MALCCYRDRTWSAAACCCSPDATLVTAGSGDGSVFVWQLHNGKLAATLKEHAAAVSCVDWSADGRKVASCDVAGSLVVWM